MTTKNWTKIANSEYSAMDAAGREQWADLRDIIAGEEED